MDNEIFVDIKGYEGLYQVSNLGRVKSLNYNRTKEERILKTDKNKDKEGYHSVTLSKYGIRKTYRKCRLVALHFIPIPKELKDIPIKDLQVNHKDENKENNCADNLEWCTQQYNIEYSQAKQVYQYDKELNLINVLKSTMECGRNGYNQKSVSSCCRGERKTHKGYIWSYNELKKSQAS